MSEIALPAGWSIARIRHDAIRSLEVWNLVLADRRRFWEVAGTPFVEAQRQARVADTLVARELATAVADAARQLHTRHRFERLWITGGLTSIAGFSAAVRGALQSAAFETRLAGRGSFAGEAGGRAVLEAHEQAGGVVADVGQTSIKVSVFPSDMSQGSSPARIQRARPLDVLPRQLIGEEPVTPASARAVTLAAAPWIAEAVHDALDAVVPRRVPAALVLGLPCPVDDDLTPGACSYGWEGDRELVPRTTAALAATGAFAGAPEVAVHVLNDAELAAAAAPTDVLTLALTLGFGPGAALVRPS